MLTHFGPSIGAETAMSPATSAAAALVGLVHGIPDVLAVELLRLRVPPSVEHRPGATPALRSYADEARTGRQSGDSFTEAFLEAAQGHGDLGQALRVVDYHQRFSDAPARFVIELRDVTVRRLEVLAAETPAGEMLVMTSEVSTLRGPRHLPLLDFKLAATPENDDVARTVAKRLGGGLLVNSGSSYHLYGLRLMLVDQLMDWLLHAQLLSRCIDTRWVTHQLIERKAALRLTRGGSRGVLPTVLDYVSTIEPRVGAFGDTAP